MTERLENQDWLTAASTQAVMAALEAGGGAGCARFVGGAVRNAVMGLAVDDVDIATSLEPQAVIEALTAAGLKHVPTGLLHGTVTAISQRTPFEITTLRRDVSTDGRNATVAFTDDWHEDAMRRDFRLNALYAGLDGTVFDPTGEGLADAHAGRIVFVGDAQTRIEEDYLRILRFFRFYAWYGKAQPDAAALAACAALKDGMARLSAERISKELLKLLAAEDPVAAVRLMQKTGVLAQVLPQGADLPRFEAVSPNTSDPILRLAALLPRSQAAGVAQRLRLSNAHRDRLIAAEATDPSVTLQMTPRAARAAIYRIGRQAFEDRLALAAAGHAGDPAPLLSALAGWEPPVLPVSGKDVVAQGVEAGPRISEVLKAAEAWWVEADFPGEEEVRKALEKLT